MKKFIKNLYLCTSLSCVALSFNYCSYAQTTMPDQASSSKQIKASITKENLNTEIDSLIIKELENKVKLDKTLFNDLNTGISGVDLININNQIKKSKEVIKEEASTSEENPNIHNVSFSELRDDSRIKQNDDAYKNTINKNKYLIEASNQKCINDAKTLIVSGQLLQAEKILDQTTLKVNNDPWLLTEIASIYDSLGKSSKAEIAYEKAISLNPRRIEILYNYALSLYKGNKLDKSQVYLSKITKINPEFTLAYYNLGNVYFKQKNYNMALRAFYKATEINPLCSDAYFNIAIILETIEHKQLALKYYYKYAELEPKDNIVQQSIKRLTGS